MKQLYEYRMALFDAYDLKEQEGCTYDWSQVCDSCIAKYGFTEAVLTEPVEDALTCGVLGCCNQASRYIDFKAGDENG